ncbi:malectin domain-containing carbohydrate-binding protein [Robertkochia marina]|nr:malectin domain-containing carbohydrate-binding protein [Robertkochia marina]
MVKLILQTISNILEQVNSKVRYAILLPFCLMISIQGFAQAPSWGATGLLNENLNNPTSLDFGPNGKLYVSQQDGIIYEYTVERNNAPAGEGKYTVTDTKVITLVKNNTPNHNDDGKLNNTKIRQITGILATGTPENPILYVASSDWRIGGKNQPGNDVNLDTNSGIITRLTWNGNAWEKVDLVRGLPRCEENHSTNGMELFSKNGQDYLFVQQGGNTNQGAPSNNFAGSSEYFLAGALLIVNLTQIEGIEAANGGPFTDLRDNTTKYVYDLPTLNDPERPDITNSSPDFPYGPGHPMYNAKIDKGDPFGGNNGLNQSFPEPNGPVQIFSPGYRNAYDIVVTENGDIYTFDNGPNGGWGGPPLIRKAGGGIKGDEYSTTLNVGAGDYITNEFNYSNGKTHGDQLHYVGSINDANNTYYAGHPVPIRAFPSKAEVIEYEYNGNDWVISKRFDWADLIKGVSGYFDQNFSMANFPDDPRQAYYTTDNKNAPGLNMLDFVNSSTNGMCVYTASNFNNQLKGNLFAASFNGNINRYVINEQNHTLIEKNNKYLAGFGSIPLDVIAQGDTEIFPGTIWAATYGADNITVFEPADFGQCFQPDEPGYEAQEDYDKDGFTNADEIANGTDHCSAGSKPSDADNDFISDLLDPDDDNDGIPDLEDKFALDANNGTGTQLPVTYPFWNNDPGTGMFGLGFTGLMLDPSGQTNYLDQFDVENMSFGGAGGKATIDFTSTGDALEDNNNQDYGFHFGINVDENSNPFTVHTKIETPFNGEQPISGQAYGVYVGTGDQDNYLKVVLMNGVNPNDAVNGIAITLESNGVTETQVYNVPGLLDAIGVDLYLGIDPKTKILQVSYSLDNGQSVPGLGTELFLPDNFFDPDDDHGLAVGLISTAGPSRTGYTATWDFINVTEDQPNRLASSPESLDFGILTINGTPTTSNIEILNLGGNEDPAIEITALNIINDPEGVFSAEQNVPVTVGSGVIQQVPITVTPNDITGKKDADLEIIHSGINSPLIVPLTLILEEAKIEEPLVRINAGAESDFMATDGGPIWEATPINGSYTGSSFSVNTGTNTSAGFEYNSRDESMPNYIDAPTFNAIFARERYDAPAGADMSFNIPIENNTYLVRLYLGSNYSGASEVGSRVFDILIEGQVVKAGFDPVAEFGFGSAGVLDFPVTLQDGEIDISFDHITENPNLYAIEILGYSIFDGVNAQALAFPVTGPAPLEVAFDGSKSSALNNIVSYKWDFGDGNTSEEISPIHTYTTPGKYNSTLTISDGNIEDTDSITISVEEPLNPEDFAILINAGGGDLTYNGKLFKKDRYFQGGTLYTNNQAAVPTLYRTERNANPPQVKYNIPLPEGNYKVLLHFAEIYLGATGGGGQAEPGKRVFDILLEEAVVLDDYDIIESVGTETPDIQEFTVEVTDGELNILLDGNPATGGVNRPKISAIEVYGENPNGKFIAINVESIPDQYNDIGESPDLSIGASGGDPNANFTFSISGQPEGIDIEPTNGLVFGTIASGARTGGPENNGVYEVTVTVSKPGSEEVNINFTWTIQEALNEWFDKDEATNYTARHECSFVQAGDKFYLMGGRENAKTIDVYDYTANSWTNIPNSPPFEFNHFQAVEYQGYIWVIGAFKTNDYPNEIPTENIWIFDPYNQTWKQGPEIPESRRRGSAGLVVYNDKFYILGGNTDGHDGGYVPYLDSYDPYTGEWTVLQNAPHARDHFHGVVAENKLYAIGGRLSGGPGGVFAPVIPEVDVYNFNTGTWSTLSSASDLPTPRAGALTVNFKGKIYVAGGEVNNNPDALDMTEVFDLDTQSWSVGDNLNYGRHGTQGVVSGNGIFVLGGSPNRAGGSQKNMEYFNYDTPSGIALSPGSIELPAEVLFSAGEEQEVFAQITEGNMGVFIDSVVVNGPDAALFSLENTFVPAMVSSIGNINFNIKYNGQGQSDIATLTVYYNNDQSVATTLTTDNIPVSEDLIPVVRINAGGKKINASDKGPIWLADNKGKQSGGDDDDDDDEDYDDKSIEHSVNTGVAYEGSELNYFDRHASMPDYIDQATFEKLFSTERYDPKAAPEMTYSIPLPDGKYTVQLYFGSLYAGTKNPGDRVFNILAENTIIEGNFDVMERFGFGVAGVISADVEVEDGSLDISFEHIKENPFINGIEVLVRGSEVNQPPVAVINADKTSGYTPLTVNFSAAESSDDFGIESYTWDFGDGKLAEGINASYTFETGGSYPVTLTVTDIFGQTDTATITIDVTDRPKPDVTAEPKTLDFGSHIINTDIVSLPLQLTNPSQPFNGVNEVISVTVMGEDVSYFEHEFSPPFSIETGGSVSAEVTFNPKTTVPGLKTAIMQVVHSGDNSPLEVTLTGTVINDPGQKPVYRINVGGATSVSATDGGPDWEQNPDNDYYRGVLYEMKGGIIGVGNLSYADRDSSIPPYIDESVYNQLYASERHIDSLNNEMEFEVVLPDGLYTLNLYTGRIDEANATYQVSLEEQEIINVDNDKFVLSKESAMMSLPVIIEDGRLNFKVNAISGTYTLNALEIISEVEFSIDDLLNLGENENGAISIYPNPASDQVNFIYSNENSELEKVMVFDINGRMIRSYLPSALSGREAFTRNGGAQLYTVPLDGLSKGIYVLIVEDNTGNQRKAKVVVGRPE